MSNKQLKVIFVIATASILLVCTLASCVVDKLRFRDDSLQTDIDHAKESIARIQRQVEKMVA